MYKYTIQLCPDSRYPGTCDAVAYDVAETCCAERSAIPLAISNTPPGPNGPTGITDTKPPAPPSPPPPPPPSPPPPPPDGWDICCIDDIDKAPFNLKYNGWRATGSDTAYMFQLVKKNLSLVDFDGPEPGDCGGMNLRDLGVSICECFERSVWPRHAGAPEAVRNSKMCMMLRCVHTGAGAE